MWLRFSLEQTQLKCVSLQQSKELIPFSTVFQDYTVHYYYYMLRFTLVLLQIICPWSCILWILLFITFKEKLYAQCILPLPVCLEYTLKLYWKKQHHFGLICPQDRVVYALPDWLWLILHPYYQQSTVWSSVDLHYQINRIKHRGLK